MHDLEELLTPEELEDYCDALVKAEEYKAQLKKYKHNNEKQKTEKDF